MPELCNIETQRNKNKHIWPLKFIFHIFMDNSSHLNITGFDVLPTDAITCQLNYITPTDFWPNDTMSFKYFDLVLKL